MYSFVSISGDEARGRRVHGHAQFIRAHVTRRRHAKASARAAMVVLQPWTVIPFFPKKASASERKAVGSQSGRSEGESASNQEQHSCSSQYVPRRGDPSHHSSLFYSTSLPPLLGSTQDPFQKLPPELKDKLSPIFARCLEHVAMDIPELDNTGKLKRLWLPVAMSEPAAMYAVFLLTESHYRATCDAETINEANLLQLKWRALAEIRLAIATPVKAHSDAIIGAVLKMAAFEALFGEPEVYEAHMRGLSVMIKMRGGLQELGMEGFLERMIVWVDVNGSYTTGAPRITGGEDLPTSHFPLSNDHNRVGSKVVHPDHVCPAEA